MQEIVFNGIKPKHNAYEISVIGNAQFDKVSFVFTSALSDLYTLEELSQFFAFVKMESAGKEYLDKVACESEYEDIEDAQHNVIGHKLTVNLILGRKSTHWRNLLTQVQFETNGGEVVAQSQIVGLILSGTINADEPISEEYPYAIQQMEDLVLTYNNRIRYLEDNAVVKSDIANSLDIESAGKVLDARQGKALNDKINDVISRVYTPQGSITVASLNALDTTQLGNGWVYDMLDSGTITLGNLPVNAGDNVAWIIDEQTQVGRWDILSGIIDLSNYPTKSGDNTFTGQNEFTTVPKITMNGIQFYDFVNNANRGKISYSTNYATLFDNDGGHIFAGGGMVRPLYDNTLDLGTSTYKWKDLYLSGMAYIGQQLHITYGGSSFQLQKQGNRALKINDTATGKGVVIDGTNQAFYPCIDNDFNLGTSGAKWKDIWFSGNLKGGATITQAQYDALVSGGTVDSDTFYFIEEE